MTTLSPLPSLLLSNQTIVDPDDASKFRLSQDDVNRMFSVTPQTVQITAKDDNDFVHQVQLRVSGKDTHRILRNALAQSGTPRTIEAEGGWMSIRRDGDLVHVALTRTEMDTPGIRKQLTLSFSFELDYANQAVAWLTRRCF